MLQDTQSHSLAGFLAGDFSRVSRALAQEICKTAKLSPDARPRNVHGERRRGALQGDPGDQDHGAADELHLAHRREGDPPRPVQADQGRVLHGGDPAARRCIAATRSSSRPAWPTARGRSRRRRRRTTPAVPLAEGEQREDDDELARVIRYANRVPLLYQQSACATFKAVLETAWRNYGLTQSRGALPAGPMVIFVHMASVWVPFTSESKEAIADYDEIRKEIKLALQECGRRLGVFLRRRERAKSEFRRRNIFELYIEEVVEACARLKGGKLPKEKLKEPAAEDRREADRRRADRRDPGQDDSGPEGLPHSIIVTPEGPRARRRRCPAPASRATRRGAGTDAARTRTGRGGAGSRWPGGQGGEADKAAGAGRSARRAASADGRSAPTAQEGAIGRRHGAEARRRPSGREEARSAWPTSVITAAERSKDPTLAIPVRSLANVNFNEKRGIIEMGKRKQARTFFNVGMAKKFMQTVLVADALCRAAAGEPHDLAPRDLLPHQAHDARTRTRTRSTTRTSPTRSSRTSR